MFPVWFTILEWDLKLHVHSFLKPTNEFINQNQFCKVDLFVDLPNYKFSQGCDSCVVKKETLQHVCYLASRIPKTIQLISYQIYIFYVLHIHTYTTSQTKFVLAICEIFVLENRLIFFILLLQKSRKNTLLVL